MLTDTIPKILIVDDEPNIVTAIEFLMQDSKYQTETAKNGLDALEKAKQFGPNIIILDVMMPHMNGYEVAKTLRSDDHYKDIKIVFLTAKGSSQDKVSGYGSGGDYYLTKPFDNNELVDLIKEVISYG